MDLMYGTAWKEADTKRCVLAALKAGFRAIDTANQRKHYFESAVGEALVAAYEEGSVKRDDLFLQTKFTFQGGQDHRLPYDPRADFATQVQQSFESSLEHLHTSFLDSYVLHGPSVGRGLADADLAVWQAMEKLQLAGRVKRIGVSNVSLEQLKLLVDSAKVKPSFVQNRCITYGWDKQIRQFCSEHDIRYQAFNLLRNPVYDSSVFQDIVRKSGKTFAQVIYRFASQLGMIVLTGTTDKEHMREAIEMSTFSLSDTEVRQIEALLE